MRIFIFGTCSGTEPEPGRRHVSFAVEYHNSLYWFDAGEGCSYTGHLMGADLMRVKKVFISHTHMDHIGGLGNLFWNIRKIDGITHSLQTREIDLFIPNIAAWEGIHKMLLQTEGSFLCPFSIHAKEFQDGILCCEDGLTITALHNHHLPHEDHTPWRSFGFSIEGDHKKIVYTGDTGGFLDYAPLLPGTDILLHETGHHDPVEVAETIAACPYPPKQLCFIHHGRQILDQYDAMLAGVTAIWGDQVMILNDQTVLTL